MSTLEMSSQKKKKIERDTLFLSKPISISILSQFLRLIFKKTQLKNVIFEDIE